MWYNRDNEERREECAMENLTWKNLCDRADGAGCMEASLRAKDEARELIMRKTGDDLDKAECPEEEVERYCTLYHILFDDSGNITDSNMRI